MQPLYLVIFLLINIVTASKSFMTVLVSDANLNYISVSAITFSF